MSLYNTLFNMDRAAPILLKLLSLEQVARFRDAYINKAGDIITVLTRCGGGNRKEYQHFFDEIHKHPQYIRDYDDDFDSTYAYIEFSVPEQWINNTRIISQIIGTDEKAMDKFKRLLEDLEAGNITTDTERAKEAGQQILDKINKGLQGEGLEEDEVTHEKFFGENIKRVSKLFKRK